MLEEYKGKIIIIVNITTQSPESRSKIEKLQNLFEEYENYMTILAFPSKDITPFFELETNEEISKELKMLGVTFPVFPLTNLSGKNIHPLIDWLCHVMYIEKTEPRTSLIFFKDKKPQPIDNNFEIFLIDQFGNPIRRFDHTFEIDNLRDYIHNLILEN